MRTAMVVLMAGLAFPVGTRAAEPPKAWEFTGLTQAAASVDVRPHVTGSLTRVAVKEGDAVAKGALLAEIDSRQYKFALDEAAAKLKVAEARLQVAKARAANAKKLLENKVIGPEEASLSVAAEAEAEAMLQAEKAGLQLAELRLSWTRLTAPFAGKVNRIQASEGGLVVADKTSILTVISTDPLYVTFNVPEGIILQLARDGLAEPGKLDVAVGLAGEEGYPHAAKLDVIVAEADPKTAAVRFRATVPNPKGQILPGLFTRVRLTPSAK